MTGVAEDVRAFSERLDLGTAEDSEDGYEFRTSV